jgi:hypothetical protein
MFEQQKSKKDTAKNSAKNLVTKISQNKQMNA